MNLQIPAKAIFFTLLIPGTVTVIVPWLLLGKTDLGNVVGFGSLQIAACILALLGAAVLLHCIWGFAAYGKGTLAPISPPEVLVVRGLYRYTRNPMYLGVVAILIAEVMYFQSPELFLYSAVVALCFHLFVIFYEEPRLRKQYGQEYVQYCQVVPRWWIAGRTFRADHGAV